MRATTASLSILKKVGGGGGVNPEQEFVNADQIIFTIAFDAIVSTEHTCSIYTNGYDSSN